MGEKGRKEVVWGRESWGLLAGFLHNSSTSESYVIFWFFVNIHIFYDTKSQPRGRNGKTRKGKEEGQEEAEAKEGRGPTTSWEWEGKKNL